MTSESAFSQFSYFSALHRGKATQTVIPVCPRRRSFLVFFLDCNSSSEHRVSFLSGASQTFLGCFFGFSAMLLVAVVNSFATVAPLFQPVSSACRAGQPPQTHRFRRTHARVPDPSALANQSLLVDVKHITTSVPANAGMWPLVVN